MKKIDIVSLVCNIILGVLYLPIAVYSFISLMVSELTVDVTTCAYIVCIDIFCVVSVLIPFLWLAGIILSLVFRLKGRSVLSLVIQFIPVMLFVQNLFLPGIADLLFLRA